MLYLREAVAAATLFVGLVTTLGAWGMDHLPRGTDYTSPIAMSVVRQHYTNAAAFQERTTLFCGGTGVIVIRLHPEYSLSPPC
jgi:hypothetical protein